MNKNLLTLISLLFVSAIAFSQPKVHFNFVTHNEETSQWNALNYYTANRAKLITLADYFQANGITWNMQSDWVYLTNVLSKETTALMAQTNNKNILRWMSEDMGVEMDPHAHESQYFYPDVVHLMDSIGLLQSKVMGGTIYNDSNGINVWTNLINGQYGRIFTNAFWQPDYMMGGGTPSHVADLKYYGFWNPHDTADYLMHDTTNHLRHLSVGCEIKIKSDITVDYVLTQIHDVMNMVQSGQYPDNGFYLQTIFFEQGDLNTDSSYDKVIAVADSVNAIVASGVAQWNTLKQTYTEWETIYNAEMFQWECGAIVNGIAEVSENNYSVYPNPASQKIYFNINSNKESELKIFNTMGVMIHQSVLTSSHNEIDIRTLAKGIYFFQLGNEENFSSGKIMID